MPTFLYLLADTMEEVFLRQVLAPPPSHEVSWEKTRDLKKASTFMSFATAADAAKGYPCVDTVVVLQILVRDGSKCDIGMEA